QAPPASAAVVTTALAVYRDVAEIVRATCRSSLSIALKIQAAVAFLVRGIDRDPDVVEDATRQLAVLPRTNSAQATEALAGRPSRSEQQRARCVGCLERSTAGARCPPASAIEWTSYSTRTRCDMRSSHMPPAEHISAVTLFA